MKATQVLSKAICESIIITGFLWGAGLTFNFINNNQLSNPFITQTSQVERQI